jgi:hypothetical protein
MKKPYLFRWFLYLAIILPTVLFNGCSKDGAVGPEGPQGIQGPQGAQGIPGTDGASIHYGNGEPAVSLGRSGDLYLDMSKSLLYGPKTAQGWNIAAPLNLKGDPGKDGSNGKDGLNGKDGVNGTNGVDGSSFLSGDGLPNATLGKNGDFYFDKANATIYGPRSQASGWGDPTSLRSTAWSGKKLLTIGDSMTSECTWQPYLVGYTGLVWSRAETTAGVGGNPASALGGITMAPQNQNSIFMRLFSMKNYNPDVIFLYGGQNDAYGNIGTINDVPYTTNAVNPSVTMASAMMGGLEILLRDNPKAKIYLVTQMRIYAALGTTHPAHDFLTMAQIEAFEKPRYEKVMLIKAIAEKYSIPCIDLWHKSGVNNYNAKEYYKDPDPGNNAQVHPNDLGGKMMALCMKTYL